MICLYFGSPDECQNCGGSASLGGTQPPVEPPHGGVYCSDDCADKAEAFKARARRGAQQ
jgi:hypothetical protein